MIEIKDLTKSFDGVEVLSHISMTLESGKIYGLVGRNGSGKTMLMKHILGCMLKLLMLFLHPCL